MLERPAFPLPRPGEIARDLKGLHLVNGFVAFLFAASGPVAIVLSVGLAGGLDQSDLASWIFGGFAIGGAITILYSLLYRQPLGFAWSIPGTVLVGPALTHLSFAEVVGAFMATGILMAVLGVSGWVRRGMEAVPLPIVMGMVAGVFLKFGLDVVAAFESGWSIALPMVVAFFGVSALPALARVVQPVLATLVVGLAAVAIGGGYAPGGTAGAVIGLPNLQVPAFSLQAMAELVIPLAVTVLVVQNGQGFTILRAAGHNPPVDSMTVGCGLGSLLFALVGTVNTCVTGPVNAIFNASGRRETRYIAALVYGGIAILFGLFSPLATRLALGLPPAFIAVLGGLAMLRVLQNAFMGAFAGRFAAGALVTFVVTVSDVTLFNIGAPFWGIVFGYAASRLLEQADFRALRDEAA